MEAESDHDQQEIKNPVKKTEREKQFRTAGVLNDVITNPQLMLQTLEKYHKTFKVVKNQYAKVKGVNIIDFSLYARGPIQDEIYTKFPFYRNNIRRGNTLLEDRKNKKVIWARKGLIKFFDISRESIQAIIEQDIVSLNEKKQQLHYLIFKDIESILSCNDEISQQGKAKIQIFKLNKANGQNAQISYVQFLDSWVVSSKNVSILIKDKNDFKSFTGQRYGFAKLIAEAWLRMIEQKNKQDLAKLKQQLIGNTIIGQYCGNPDFQHLVKYNQITIYFYALVNNQSKFTCEPPNEAFRFFQRHQLPIVKNYENSLAGRFTNFVELGKKLQTIFSEVASASIFQQEEGSVLYFVIHQTRQFCQYVSDRYLENSVTIPENWQKQIKPWVCSLGKLKTLQYRILRKLREKLKYFTRIKNKVDQSKERKEDQFKKFQERYGSFEKEVYRLVKKDKLSKPLEYFFCVGLIAFEYVFKYRKASKPLQLFNKHFLDFLSVIFWAIENKKQVTQNLMDDWQLINEIKGVNWDKYGIQIINNYPAMLQEIVPKYAKIKKSEIVDNEENEEVIEDNEQQI